MNQEMIAAGLLESNPSTLSTDMLELRDNVGYSFDRLLDVTAVDHGETFELIYRLNSLQTDRDLVVKVSIDAEKPEIASVSEIWEAALFGEREVQDMFGIVFVGHPDSRPLLAPEDGFGFFPLRKSYKLPGRTSRQAGR